MRKMKKAAALLMAGVMAFSLGGCGGGNSGTTGAAGSQGTEQGGAGQDSAAQSSKDGAETAGKSVKFWISSGAEDDIYRAMFRDIEGKLGVTIVDEYYSKDELDSKMQVSTIAGDMPDALIADYLLLPNYCEAGMIAPIDEYMTDDIKSDLLSSVVDEATVNGQLVAVAQFDGGMAMWGNKEMLDKAGVRIPASYKEAWDRQEFEAALAALKDSGVEYPLYVRQNNPSTMYYTYMPVIKSFGGDYADRDTMMTEGTLDGEGTTQALEYLTWMVEQGYINPTCDYDDAFETRKESALSLVGHWKYTNYKDGIGEDNLVLIPIPDFGNGVYTCSGSVVWAMTSGAKENGSADVVWQIMKAAMEPDNIEKVVSINGAIPARKSVMDSIPQYQEGGKLYLYREQLEAGISYLRPFTSAHMTIYDQMKAVYGDIFAGADAAESLKNASAAIDEIISENGWGAQ